MLDCFKYEKEDQLWANSNLSVLNVLIHLGSSFCIALLGTLPLV